MILILEGVNRTGKTTIAKKLTKYGFEYFKNKEVELVLNHNKIDKQSFFNGEIIGMLNMLRFIGKDKKLLIDRFHFTEFAYGLVERQYITEYILDVDKALKSLGAKLLYMYDDIKKINKRANKDLSKHKLAMDLMFETSAIDKFKHNSMEITNNLANWLELPIYSLNAKR